MNHHHASAMLLWLQCCTRWTVRQSVDQRWVIVVLQLFDSTDGEEIQRSSMRSKKQWFGFRWAIFVEPQNQRYYNKAKRVDDCCVNVDCQWSIVQSWISGSKFGLQKIGKRSYVFRMATYAMFQRFFSCFNPPTINSMGWGAWTKRSWRTLPTNDSREAQKLQMFPC